MTIDNFIKRGALVKEPTSKQEIIDLFKIVDRDYNVSAQEGITYDWQFGIAYNAALKLANILVRASGYRVKGQGHHMNVISLIPDILGMHKKDDSEYLDTCRRKRNRVEYDCVGGATKADVTEIRGFVNEFKEEVIHWLKDNYSEFLS
ncbi:MAG: hypothetical protein ISR65_20475 [Bacteriovoracaceae bacterium]|nr:hypothetical protein [Bacteriovoracaceae bacterium]